MIAVDVGYGQLDWSLRTDPRVHVLERTNVRTLRVEDLPWQPDAAVGDLSFISLRLVLPPLTRIVPEEGDLLLLVKPQFEVGKESVGRGGVVRDPALWRSSMQGVVTAAEGLGWGLVGTSLSDLQGPAGNREFFVHLQKGHDSEMESIERAIAAVAGPHSTA